MRSDLARLRLDKKPYAMVTGKRGIKTNVRSSPKLNSKVLYAAMSGDVVTLESAPQQVGQYPWYYVRFTNGVRGWVRGDQLSFWQRGCIISCPEY
ncbi:hypothetical protein IJ00_06120 [Calothrix sp. 336/3]|nr:hypothetical protein IJ00_06120 [Calothrix sp. 336/3]